MRLQPTAMFGIFIGTTRYYRTGPACWPCLHISNCYHGELSPYLLNAPVITLSLAVLLIFIEPEPAENFRVFTQTCHIVNTRRLLDSLSPRNFFPHLVAHGAPSGIAIFALFPALSILGTFPVYELAHRIKRGHRLPRDLCISRPTGHSSYQLAHQF